MTALSSEQFHTLENFGHSLRAPSYRYRPECTEEICEIFRLAKQNGLTVTARGAGRSYNDAALNGGGIILDMTGMNHILEWDEAAGDRYKTFPSLMANGIGSVVASLFGSVFPTTIYIGHPGWKQLGARSGYSSLNGIFIAFLCLTGTIQAVLGVIPLEAGIGILLYIGIIIVAQSFQETPKEHAPAVALGLVPALAGWGLMMVETGLRAAGKSLFEVGLGKFSHESVAIHGMISLERGFIFTSMILAAIGVALIERKFAYAGMWSVAAALLSACGIIHAYELAAGGITSKFGLMAAPEFFIAYLAMAVIFFAMGWLAERQ